MLYKISSWFFAGLAILNTTMFFITHHLSNKVLIATAKEDTKGAFVSISGNIIPDFFKKMAGVLLPMWIFSQIKGYLKRKRRKRRRRINSIILLIISLFAVIGFIRRR